MPIAGSRLIPPFLTAEWRKPLLLSWPVDDVLLDPLVPPGLELDRWRGAAYVSLVGIRFERVRVLGLPSPFGPFDEVNLRFYVRGASRDSDTGNGVVFIRQFVPQRMTAHAARALYGEPFVVASTGHHFAASGPDRSNPRQEVAYQWSHLGQLHLFRAAAETPSCEAAPGSLAEFLTARYWGYNGRRGHAPRAYRLTRPVWKGQRRIILGGGR